MAQVCQEQPRDIPCTVPRVLKQMPPIEDCGAEPTGSGPSPEGPARRTQAGSLAERLLLPEHPGSRTPKGTELKSRSEMYAAEGTAVRHHVGSREGSLNETSENQTSKRITQFADFLGTRRTLTLNPFVPPTVSCPPGTGRPLAGTRPF